MNTIPSTPFRLFRDENAVTDTRIKPSVATTGNVPLKSGLGVPQSNRKALSNVSDSQINIRQTPANKQSFGGKTNTSLKPKTVVQSQIITVEEESPDYNLVVCN